MGQWTTYSDSTTPAGTWTILCYPGSGALQEVALSSVMTQLIPTSKALSVAGAIGAVTARQISVAGVASPVFLLTTGLEIDGTGHFEVVNGIRIEANGGGLGFFGASAMAKPTITGSRAGNAALQSLLDQLESYGLIVNSTS